jgi:putative spermidine/putrescine transport system permease protein
MPTMSVDAGSVDAPSRLDVRSGGAEVHERLEQQGQGLLPEHVGHPDLRTRLQRVRRQQMIFGLLLIAPLFAFICVCFLIPILAMLRLSVDNSEIATALPRTTSAIAAWTDRSNLPSEEIAEALVSDLRALSELQRVMAGSAARRLNLEIAGYRTLLLSTVRAADGLGPPYLEALIEHDPRWRDVDYWAVLWRNTTRYTDYYLLGAVDLQRDVNAEIVRTPEPIFLNIFARTLWFGILITAICLILAYPVAFVLATVTDRVANLLMFFVMLPFWTSILVRTSAWIVLLQTEGLVNQSLVWIGVISEPLQLVFNRPGVTIAMVHVMLPFMILPIYSVMKGIDPQYVRAARSLGANGLYAFSTVHLPMTLPGVGAGCSLVFILTLGYYITPQLIGGPRDQLISSFIASYTNTLLNWGLASALASILLILVLILYITFQRFLRIESIRMG